MCRKKNKTEQHETPRVCRFCESALVINDDDNVLCERHGIVNNSYCCKKFSYDPLKRAPLAPPALPKLSPEDVLL